MIRVSAPSRLHFGLLSLPTRAADESSTLPTRHFGGVGLMIDRPGVEVAVRRADAWSASGPFSDRALAFAQRFVASLPDGQRRVAFALDVQRCAPEHAGLGTGTQLALATARAAALATGHADLSAVDLAQRMGRGLRSSLGIHGFERGGLLVEGGKTAHTTIAPLLLRQAFPEDWRVLLVVPSGIKGAHGAHEREAFAQLAKDQPNEQRTEALCRLVLLGLLPALVERDLAAFGEALYEFNRRVGEMFAPWQGGTYAHPRTTEIIGWLRQHGMRGVGQSSWGPTVFAIERLDVLERARHFLLKKGDVRPEELWLCGAANQGAATSSGGSAS